MIAGAAKKLRLDALLVDRGLADSRARAHAMVLAGEVYVHGTRADKPGMQVPGDAVVEVRLRRPVFASRGGYKLDYALRTFGLDVVGVVAADIGASTGGFTDCLLQRGARTVYAIDVGTGQLSWQLRRDSRVVNLEQRDVRTVTAEELGGPVDLATVDVAFISLARVMPAVARLVRPGGTVLALLKPQFEVGPKVAKGGVVRDPVDHQTVLARAIARLEEGGFTVEAATASPLVAPNGNLEFFLHLRNSPGRARAIDVAGVVAAAHATVLRRGRGARATAQR